MTRWISRTPRVRARDVVIAIAVTLVLIGAWRFYAAWRTGRVELIAVGEPVAVQILDEKSEEPVGERVGVVDRAVIELPDGEYKLRVEGKGRLSRTFRFSVNRGETLSHSISIDEGRLLGGEPRALTDDANRKGPVRIPAGSAAGALELVRGKTDFVVCTEDKLIRRDGATGNVVWQVFVPQNLTARLAESESLRWRVSNLGVRRSHFVQPAPDLDGDGTGDVLLNLPAHGVFAAFSGKNGALRWTYFAGADGRANPPPNELHRAIPLPTGVIFAGEPAMSDVNHDGTPDLIATLTVSRSIRQERRVVVAISGRTGEWIWSYPMDAKPRSRSPVDLERVAVLVEGRESKWVAYVDDSEWIGLDAATGKRRAGIIDLGLKPVVPVQHVDLDGDGEPEIVAYGQEPAGNKRTMRVMSVKSGGELWSRRVDAVSDRLLARDLSGDLPSIVDVDGDGRPELLVRDTGPMPPLRGSMGVRLLDGQTGATRWRTLISPADIDADDRIDAAITGPDLDRDGASELVLVTAWGRDKPKAIYADALSGKDGRRLWSWNVETEGRPTSIGRPRWWSRGADGWPLLAVPLGGASLMQSSRQRIGVPGAAPIVHLLEASTGQERHRVLGLENAQLAELDGDGLDDLWGVAEGELRGFRGEPREVWRALGRFDHAGRTRDGLPAFIRLAGIPRARLFGEPSVSAGRDHTIDLDGDGVGDALTGELNAPGEGPQERSGSRTAVARSGRDGRVIWKTGIDPRARWFNPTSGDDYELLALPLPAGDLDGDGTADVIVKKRFATRGVMQSGAGRLDIELLSGRTGNRVWSGVRLPASARWNQSPRVGWVEACVIESNGSPDIIVGGNTPSGSAGLLRVSGRDGRVVWVGDVDRQFGVIEAPRYFGDLDGDGGLDALLVTRIPGVRGQDETGVAISLRDGKRLWSATLGPSSSFSGQVRVGDIDGDGRLDVIVFDENFDSQYPVPRVRVLGGRDGKLRWSWALADSRACFVDDVTLANFDGGATRYVCATFRDPTGACEMIVLDPSGKERRRRGLESGAFHTHQADVAAPAPAKQAFRGGVSLAQTELTGLTAADLDGDGRDELVMYHGDRFQAWDHDLKELWFWPSRFHEIEHIIPAAHGWPGRVAVRGGVFLDAATGQPRWMGQAPLEESIDRLLPGILDPGDSARAPLLIASASDATVCRAAIATNANGSAAPARGNEVVHGLLPNDPRWARPLPWTKKLVGAFGPSGFLVSGCLAFANLFVPVLILWLTTRRRRAFHVWTLMIWPVVAAVPLVVYQTVLPWLSAVEGRVLSTENRVFLIGTLAGGPVVYWVALLGLALLRRRWKRASAFLAFSALATLVVAAVWFLVDRPMMAPMEHYVWDGWALVALVGGYSAATIWAVGEASFGVYSLVIRRVSIGHRTT